MRSKSKDNFKAMLDDVHSVSTTVQWHMFKDWVLRDGVTVALFRTDPRDMSDEFQGGWRACGLQPSTTLPPGARAPCAGAHSWRPDHWRLRASRLHPLQPGMYKGAPQREPVQINWVARGLRVPHLLDDSKRMLMPAERLFSNCQSCQVSNFQPRAAP